MVYRKRLWRMGVLALGVGLVFAGENPKAAAQDFPQVNIVHLPKGKAKSAVINMAVLGMDALANCRMILDFPGETLYLSPYADYNHTPERDLRRLGIIVGRSQKESSRSSILALFAGYPAMQAGLKVGDELLDVNGIASDKWLVNPDIMLQDTTLTLHFRRKGTAEPLTLTLSTPAIAQTQEKTPPLVPVKHYNPGDVMLFPDGGQVIGPGNPLKIITIPPGGSYIYRSDLAVIWNPPGKQVPARSQ